MNFDEDDESLIRFDKEALDYDYFCDLYYRPLIKELEEKDILRDRERLIDTFRD